jgi:hypothetical protein
MGVKAGHSRERKKEQTAMCDKVRRKICGPKWEATAGGWGDWCNDSSMNRTPRHIVFGEECAVTELRIRKAKHTAREFQR